MLEQTVFNFQSSLPSTTEKTVTEIEMKGQKTGTGIVTEIVTEIGNETGTAKLPTRP